MLTDHFFGKPFDPSHHFRAVQHCTAILPIHAIPATPEDHLKGFSVFYSQVLRPSLDVQKVGIFNSLTRLHIGSLSLRPAPLPIGNLQPLVTQTLLPGAKKAYGQFLLKDFNLLELQLLRHTDTLLN